MYSLRLCRFAITLIYRCTLCDRTRSPVFYLYMYIIHTLCACVFMLPSRGRPSPVVCNPTIFARPQQKRRWIRAPAQSPFARLFLVYFFYLRLQHIFTSY